MNEIEVCIGSVICFKNLVKTLRSHSLKNLKKIYYNNNNKVHKTINKIPSSYIYSSLSLQCIHVIPINNTANTTPTHFATCVPRLHTKLVG